MSRKDTISHLSGSQIEFIRKQDNFLELRSLATKHLLDWHAIQSNFKNSILERIHQNGKLRTNKKKEIF